jgi:hypothetical protein
LRIGESFLFFGRRRRRRRRRREEAEVPVVDRYFFKSS